MQSHRITDAINEKKKAVDRKKILNSLLPVKGCGLVRRSRSLPGSNRLN